MGLFGELEKHFPMNLTSSIYYKIMFTGNGLSRIRSFYSSSKLNLPVLKSYTEQSNQGNIIILKFYFFESVKVLGILWNFVNWMLE